MATPTLAGLIDEEAERATLCCLANTPNQSTFDGILKRIGNPDAFHSERHKLILSVLVAMRKACEPIDPILVKAELARRGVTDHDRFLYDLFFTMHHACDPRGSWKYAERVRDLYARRCLVAASQGAANSREPLANILSRLPTDRIPDAQRSTHLATLMSSSQFGAGLPTVTSGFDGIDAALSGGFRPACSYLVAGSTGFGKSTLCANVARRAALAGAQVLLFKLEESLVEMSWRLLAAAANLPFSMFLDGLDRVSDASALQAVADGKALLATLPISLSADRDLRDIETSVRAFAGDAPMPRLVLLDQLSFVRAQEFEPGYPLVSEVSNRIRELATATATPIVCMAQVNRGAATRDKDKAPLGLSDLRDSGQLENDATAVLMLQKSREGTAYGGEVYRTLELTLPKNRYGMRVDVENPILLDWFYRLGRMEDAPMDASHADSVSKL